MSRGTFASFTLKRRPVGCASDSVWRSVGSCGMATADCEANRVDKNVYTDPDMNLPSDSLNVGSSSKLSRFDDTASDCSFGLCIC